jgi:hypothetical protein
VRSNHAAAKINQRQLPACGIPSAGKVAVAAGSPRVLNHACAAVKSGKHSRVERYCRSSAAGHLLGHALKALNKHHRNAQLQQLWAEWINHRPYTQERGMFEHTERR